MQQDSSILHLDNQLCFLIYSTNLALHQLYRKLLAPSDSPTHSIWSCWCFGKRII